MPYIGRSTDGFGVRNRFLYLASASDTSVSGADANGATLTFTDGAYVDVYLNGVLLKAGTDYNTNTANTIAGLSALAANDEVTVIVYDVFTVGDMVSATSGGTFTGNVTHNGTVTFGSTVSGLDVNGTEVILDADGDTTITADTDDQIDIKIAGADDFQFTANTFTAQSGSTIAAQALTATTITATGDVSLDGGSFVFNESSADKDFRVESNGNTHMLFVDGGNNGVGIGTSSADTNATMTVSNTGDNHAISIVGALNKSRMHFQGANTGSGSTDGLVIGLSSSDDTNDDSALIGLKESGSMTFQTSGTNHMIIDGAGHVTMPKQSAFNAYVTIAISNLAQGGSTTVLRFQTERFDQNADYNTSTYTFTAPVTGKYQFNASVRLDQMQSNTNYNYVSFKTSNRDYAFWLSAPEDWNGGAYYTANGSVLADLDANDTCYIGYVGQGGTDSTDHTDGYFSGFLVA